MSPLRGLNVEENGGLRDQFSDVSEFFDGIRDAVMHTVVPDDSPVVHASNCPQFTITQINWEAGSRRIKEQDVWVKGVFPAAHEALKQAAAAMPPGTAAQPFLDALTELV